ncbi:hypothetical protein SAMN05428987_0208 [Paenibacillus sp. CF095]|nr:hypothetical protein [Paenibacillus sp. CF095]SDE01830.1 hypothetical protein SAMN05428987_0208 [Paenibacillus sp. CF095]
MKQENKVIGIEEYRRMKILRNYPKPKPIKRLTEEQMKSSNEKRRRED